MQSGVFIGKSNQGNFDLVSTGDYVNPISTAFKLKDLRKTIAQTHKLYLIVNDISIEYIKLELTGHVTFIRCYLSWDNQHWVNDKLELHQVINTIDTPPQIIPFYLRVVCDDYLEYFSLTSESVFHQYKLKLIYI